MLFAKTVKKLLRGLGYDVRRHAVSSSGPLRFATILASNRINVVFDVGANVGQFGEALREIGYRGRIVSFEPLSAARAELLRRSRGDPLWDVAPQAAIGDHDGEVEIHIAGNSVSSSVLGMLEAHSAVAPESVYVGAERVPVRRLDGFAADYLQPDSILFLKIDTQGYEHQVIQGATSLLGRAAGCQLEVSLVPLYESQIGYLDLLGQMASMGFGLWDATPVLVDEKSGRVLQIDATFVRG